MRVGNWKVKEALGEHRDRIIANGVKFMQDVAERAKAKCPVSRSEYVYDYNGKKVRVRPENFKKEFTTAQVDFIRSRGKGSQGKGTRANFRAERWLGREQGGLRDSIRLVNKNGNIRVYVGNYKLYFSHMVERGTVNSSKQPFLRPAFFAARGHLMKQLKYGDVV